MTTAKKDMGKTKDADAVGIESTALFAVSGTELDVCRDIETRQQMGIRKYGMTVATNPLHLREWLQHAYEEHLDAAVYLKRAIGMLAPPCGEFGGSMGDCPRWQNGLCTCEANAIGEAQPPAKNV